MSESGWIAEFLQFYLEKPRSELSASLSMTFFEKEAEL